MDLARSHALLARDGLALGDGSVFAADFGAAACTGWTPPTESGWSHQLNEVILRGAPVVSGDAVIVGLADGRLVAVDSASGQLIWQEDLTEGALGAVAISDDALIAVTGGPEAGLVALENDPEGTLVDVPSPTEFDLGTTFGRCRRCGDDRLLRRVRSRGSARGGGSAPASSRRRRGRRA